MANCAQDFLTLACEMQVSATNEIGMRTAANRAYYSVYHNAKNIKNLVNLPDSQGAGGVHAKLFRSLEECKPRHSSMQTEIRQVGIFATRQLKTLRTDADYDIDITFDKVKMDETIAKSQLLMGKISTILSQHKLPSPSPTTEDEPLSTDKPEIGAPVPRSRFHLRAVK
ncbi:hypothetical protein OYT1_ch1648 [Ferriphaselus amnicola]|uniref:HEPN domain-containing protein n=1 Tax=Ferriphaselus amnicola TaxID=1188319 RepID=A0A2Z6GC69_9PROT|nr:hypothetical protein [Ferriphaselus amnicola]BBE51193.1 hypothetical protein OYT1_ch1648 [Ferriphaselus amnicola]